MGRCGGEVLHRHTASQDLLDHLQDLQDHLQDLQDHLYDLQDHLEDLLGTS